MNKQSLGLGFVFIIGLTSISARADWCQDANGKQFQVTGTCDQAATQQKNTGLMTISGPTGGNQTSTDGAPGVAKAAGSDAQAAIDAQKKFDDAQDQQSLTQAQQNQARENAAGQSQTGDINSYNSSIGQANALRATPEDKSGEDASCATAHQLGMTCKNTDAQIKSFQNIGVATQAIGASVVGITGQVQNMNAAQSGSQVGMIQAQANIQKMGAEAYMATGAMTTAFGVINLQSASKHDANADALKAVKGNIKVNDDSTASVATKFKNNGYYTTDGSYEGQAAGSIKDKDQLNGITQAIVNKGVLSGGKVIGAENGGLEAYGTALTSIKPNQAAAVARKFPGQSPTGAQADDTGHNLMASVERSWPQAVTQITGQQPGTPGYLAVFKSQSRKQAYLNSQQDYLDGQSLVEVAPTLDQRANQVVGRQKNLNGLINSTAQQAATEQTNEAEKARQAGVVSLVQGVAQLAQGALTYEAAKIAEQEALNYNTGNTQPAFQVTSGMAQTLSPTNPTTTTLQPGTGGDTPPPTNPGNINAQAIPNLGTPINPDATSGGAGGGPAPNSFAGGLPQGGSPGGGGPGISVGATQADKSTGEPDNSPRAAPQGPPSNYNASGTGYIAGGGSVGAEKGQDLSFLANLLPKKEDEASKNGILDFGKNRSPASMAPYSLLGRDVNLFKRISDTMSEKAKSGSVGI